MRVVWLIFLPAALYQCLAIIASLKHWAKRPPPPWTDAVSVLKPLRGIDPNTMAAFVSQLEQKHPKFEVLFAARDLADPAALAVVTLQRERPGAPIGLFTSAAQAPNGKVGLLAELSQRARYPLRVVNDSDIKVDAHYLAAVTAPLADQKVGVVTCLYRVKPHNLAAAWEALGIMTDFMPSTIVAQMLGIREFGLGSTLAFRAKDLAAAGGFESFAEYIADDYLLAKRIVALGKRVELSTYVVETALSEASWRGVWRHQLRWARTIRLSKGGAYLGLPIAHAGVWMLAAALAGAGPVVAVLATLRIMAALLAGGLVLKSVLAVGFCWVSPIWDLYSFSIWLASYCGRQVHWRDRVLTIDREGRIVAG